MGMHVFYELRARCGGLHEAEGLVRGLHAAAMNLPFDRVTHVRPVRTAPGGADGTFAIEHVELPQAGESKVRYLPFYPIEGLAFVVFPGEGCESASFGLARYPRTVLDDETGSTHPTGFGDEFYWHSGCKTQYAFRVSPEHFLRCHLSLVDLLDRANALGMVERVNDEGGYWEGRSVEALLARRQEHDEMVAAMVGPIIDALSGAGGHIVAPITGDPRFEYLEAEGRRKLDQGRAGTKTADAALE